MNALDQAKVWRRGAQVQRWHTQPMLRQQSVGAHTFNCCTLMLTVYPTASTELLQAMLMHDMAEQDTGDIPSTAKWRWPVLARALQQVEMEWESSVGINVMLAGLSDFERWLIRWCDYVELLLWSTEELRMGNENAQEPVRNIIRALDSLTSPTPVTGRTEELYRAARADAVAALTNRNITL
jgi:5'-deoxynucleotidase YfbR-like HD superfamily hydrolase